MGGWIGDGIMNGEKGIVKEVAALFGRFLTVKFFLSHYTPSLDLWNSGETTVREEGKGMGKVLRVLLSGRWLPRNQG